MRRFSRAFHEYPSISKLLVVFSVSGGGLVAYAESNPGAQAIVDTEAENKRKRVVVLGTGWAGTSFLKNLKNPSYDVQVISPRNYFAFTPLLPSVTCGTVEARSVVEPIRRIVEKKNMDIRFQEAECVKIDAENKKVYCRTNNGFHLDGKEEFVVDYDYLVITIGARSNTFNIPGVEENCHFLKEVEDAQKIRRSVIDCFERASLANLSDDERKRILHFVVVGGGPTGVEFAAELHDFVNEDLVKLYPGVEELVSITLLEAADHILNMFDERITEFAETKFRRDGIDLKTGSMVVKVSDKDITTKERSGEVSSIPYGMAVWSTGIGTRPVIRDFMKQVGQANRRALATDEWLRVEGTDSVYALGDCATINQRKVMEDISAIFSKADQDNSGTLTATEAREVITDICERYPQVELYLKNNKLKDIVDLLKESKGDVQKETIELNIEEFKAALSQVDSQMKNLPATAQVAAQQGTYLADCFNRMEECEKYPEGPLRFRGSGRHRFRPFRYKHFGQFAPLGGEQTAAQLPGDWVSIGRSSQWLWYSVYASKQVSWRTRIFAGYNKSIRIFDVHRPGREFEQYATLKGKNEGQAGIISAIAFSPAHTGLLATGSYSQTTAIYTEDNMELLYVLHGQQGGVTHVMFSKDGNYLYTGGRKDPYIMCWDVRKAVDVVYKLYRSSEDTNQRIYFDIEPRGQHLATGGQDGLVHVYDVQTGRWVTGFQAASDTVNGFSFHPFLPMAVSSSGQRRFDVPDNNDEVELHLQDDENCLSVWSFSGHPTADDLPSADG